MKCWRMAAIATSLMFITAAAFPQGALGKGREKNNEPPKQSGGSSGSRENPPQRERNDNNPPPRQRNEEPAPKPRQDSPPPRQRNEDPPKGVGDSNGSRPPISPPIRDRNDSGRDGGQGQLGKGRNNGNSNGSSGNQGGSGNQGSKGNSGSSSGNNGSKGNSGSNSGGSSSNNGSKGNSGNGGNSNGSGGYSGGSSTGNQGSPPIGRINNPPTQGNGGVTSGRDMNRQQSGALSKGRNGGSYNTNNNQYQADRSKPPAPFTKPPVGAFGGGGTLGNQVIREDHPREVRNRWRSGYWGYNNWWCDDDFRFGWYVFDCNRGTRCVSSPWYWYPHLPGYVNYSCISIMTLNFGPWYGNDYRYRRWDDYGYYSDRSALDYSIDDLERAFENRDSRAIGRLIPRRGYVNVWSDGRYSYSMNADAFYDLMEDNVFGTRTVRYEILSVRTNRDEAEVRARHEFEDPWGRRCSVYHWYRLERERDGYVIRNFGASDSRW